MVRTFRADRGDLPPDTNPWNYFWETDDCPRESHVARTKVACVWLGKFIDARAYFEKYLSLWDPMHRAVWRAPEYLYVAGLGDLSRTLLCLGYIDQARLRRNEALVEARRFLPYALAFGLLHSWAVDRRGDTS